MTTPNNPQGPFDVQALLGRKIAEAAGQELINGLLGGGAKRGLDAGLNMAKDIKLGDIFSTVATVIEDANTARAEATAAEAKAKKSDEGAVYIPFTKAETKATPSAPAASSPVPAEPAVQEEESVIIFATGSKGGPGVRNSSDTLKTVLPEDKKDTTKESDESIDAIYDLATNKLTAEEQSRLVTSVMNLVRLASPEGFTGEHVRWLSRLYGNKSL